MTQDSINRNGLIFFISGTLLMIMVLVLGNSIEDILISDGIKALELRQDPQLGLVLLFAFGFPLGLVLTLVGACLISNSSRKKALTYFVIGFILVTLAAIVPQIFGSHLGGLYFGSGGVIIMISMVISFWFWAQNRLALDPPARKPADLKALGYLCFGLAAWNTCGLAAMPSFALFPELMIQQGVRPFAIGQAKAIMAYFVLGWLLTAAGMYASAKSSKR